MSFQKKLVFLDGRRYHKIEITEYPEDIDCRMKKQSHWEEENRKYLPGKSYLTTDADNNFYYNENNENIKSATDKCMDIICKHNRIGKDYFNDCQKKNFYCPIHENPDSSNSKSGQLLIKKNLYICYSSNCSLPANRNGHRIVSTIKFLSFYKK